MTDRDKLIALIKNAFLEEYEKRDFITEEHTADYLLANGVIVPTVKVGQTVYTIVNRGVQEWDIASYILDSEGISFVNLAYMDGKIYTNTYLTNEIGKTVFLTKEEAEEKLKELNSK